MHFFQHRGITTSCKISVRFVQTADCVFRKRRNKTNRLKKNAGNYGTYMKVMKHYKRVLLFLSIYLSVSGQGFSQQISTLAGSNGSTGYINAAGAQARFNEPCGVATDKYGNIYIADRLNHVIRKITPAGITTTLAGSGIQGAGDGPALSATFNKPMGVACDTLGNLYIADTDNFRIRKLDSLGNVTTLAGFGISGSTNGAALTARFGLPVAIAVTRDGSTVYVSDHTLHTIRKISGGQVSTLAGSPYMIGSSDGTGAAASFYNPNGIALSNAGELFLADEGNHKIRKITSTGQVSTIAGNGLSGSTDGSGLSAQFNHPVAITVDAIGNVLITDRDNHTIRLLSSVSNQVSTLAGLALNPGCIDGNGSTARLNLPSGISYNINDRAVYFCDKGSHTVRKSLQVSSLSVQVNITGGSQFCSGQHIQIMANPQGMSQYNLYLNGQLQATATTGQFVFSNLPAGNHSFSISAIDPNGAVAQSTPVNVVVYPPYTPQILSSNGNGICPGSTMMLSAGTGSAFLWSNGATSSSINVSSPGVFSVTVTNNNGCTGTSNPFTLVGYSSPVVQLIAAADTICRESTALLTANGGSSWSWSNGLASQSIQASAGTYTCTVTDTNGCSVVSAPVSVFSFPRPSPLISPAGNQLIIQGDSLLLTSSGLNSYQWSNGQTTSAIWVNAAGNYAVNGTSANFCLSDTVSVEVQVFSQSDLLSVVSGSVSFCEGDSVILKSAFNSGNQWQFNGNAIPGAVNSQFTAKDSGWYAVSIYHNGIWHLSDSILINVYHRPALPIINDTIVCEGSSIVIQAPPVAGLQYSWYTQSVGGQPVASGNELFLPSLSMPTDYFVEVSGQTGCTSNGRTQFNINISPLPSAQFTHTIQEANSNYTITCYPDYTSAMNYDWFLTDPSGTVHTSNDQQPVFQFTRPGNAEIILFVVNEAGCQSTGQIKILAGALKPPFIPTTFTPNGDGRNDVFRVRGEAYTVNSMQVFDQWGSLIYSSGSNVNEWDGRSNGEPVPNGTYLYRVLISDPFQTSRELTGPITVIR